MFGTQQRTRQPTRWPPHGPSEPICLCPAPEQSDARFLFEVADELSRDRDLVARLQQSPRIQALLDEMEARARVPRLTGPAFAAIPALAAPPGPPGKGPLEHVLKVRQGTLKMVLVCRIFSS